MRRKATDYGRQMPSRHVVERARLDAFAEECRHISGPELVQWLTEMDRLDPARPIVEGELNRRDHLPHIEDEGPYGLG